MCGGPRGRFGPRAPGFLLHGSTVYVDWPAAPIRRDERCRDRECQACRRTGRDLSESSVEEEQSTGKANANDTGDDVLAATPRPSTASG
jgi:hypothetical protein